MNKYIPPEFKTIQKANAGDSDAMQKLLAHYNTYIMFFANTMVLSIMCTRRKSKQG